MPNRKQLIGRLRNRDRSLSYDQRRAIADLLEHDAAVLGEQVVLIQAVDDLFAYLMESGSVEEGGGLKLYEAMKPLADARSNLGGNPDA